jgi:hypothetical protein
MIHGQYITSWFDLDRVAGLDLHGGYIVGRQADLVGADRAD